ncbi:MAG: NAD(P)H-binding protein [Bacteroidia bacterium]
MSINAPFFDALILGYTGLTGDLLLRELMKSDKVKHIICLGRKAPSFDHHKVQFIQADMNRLTEHTDAFGSVSRVFCCLGTTIKKAGSKNAFRRVDYDMVVNAALVAAQAGVNHFSVVSAVGAEAKSGIFYNQVKGEMEAALIQTGLPRLSIFRPGLLLGKREEFRFGERLGIALVPLFEWMIPKRFRSIKAETVARAMLLNAIKTDEGIEIFFNGDMEVLSKSL